jgi:hypothetical protein
MRSTFGTIILFVFIVLGILAVVSVVTSPTFRNVHIASPSWHDTGSSWS